MSLAAQLDPLLEADERKAKLDELYAPPSRPSRPSVVTDQLLDLMAPAARARQP